MDRDVDKPLHAEMKVYRYVAYYLGVVGILSALSPFLFERPFSGTQWTGYCLVLAALYLLSAYALHSFKTWAAYLTVCSLFTSGFGQTYFNPQASYVVYILPFLLSVLVVSQHLRLMRLRKRGG